MQHMTSKTRINCFTAQMNNYHDTQYEVRFYCFTENLVGQ